MPIRNTTSNSIPFAECTVSSAKPSSAWLLRCAKGDLSQKRSNAMSAARLGSDVVVPMLSPLRSILKDKRAILLGERIRVFFNFC